MATRRRVGSESLDRLPEMVEASTPADVARKRDFSNSQRGELAEVVWRLDRFRQRIEQQKPL